MRKRRLGFSATLDEPIVQCFSDTCLLCVTHLQVGYHNMRVALKALSCKYFEILMCLMLVRLVVAH